jgi:hypothetical protein
MAKQALEFGPALETDIPAIRHLLLEVFGSPEDWRMFQPEVLRWKAFHPHPLWSGSRSYVVRAGDQIVAHGCMVPSEVLTGTEPLRGTRIIDWVAKKGFPGTGSRIFNGILGLLDVVFAVGGSQDTLRILPLIGFKKTQMGARYARVIRPLRRWRMSGDRSWKGPARAARDLLRIAKPAHSAGAEWSIRRVGQFDETAAPVMPQAPGPGDFMPCRRTPELLNYLLACPAAAMEGYLLFRGGHMAGYAMLSRVGQECRVAEVRIASSSLNDWADAYAVAANAAARAPETTMLIARAFSPVLSASLEGAGFRTMAAEPLFRKERQTQVWPDDRMVELGMLDDDYFYL